MDKEHKEDEPDIGDINVVIDDDFDENMLQNDIDDDDEDILNPLNTLSKPEDDTYFEFDEEEESEEG
jgi:hypothetical protein